MKGATSASEWNNEAIKPIKPIKPIKMICVSLSVVRASAASERERNGDTRGEEPPRSPEVDLQKRSDRNGTGTASKGKEGA